MYTYPGQVVRDIGASFQARSVTREKATPQEVLFGRAYSGDNPMGAAQTGN